MSPTWFFPDRSRRFAFALCAALAVAPLDARAQDEGIEADRPDFTNSPSPLAPGVAQLEAGWTREHAVSGPTNTFGLGVLRWGIANRVELRADVPSWIRQDIGPSFDSGFGDAGVGAKFLLAEGKGAWPSFGVIADLDLPTGAEGFGSSGAGYNGTLAAERDFGAIDASANLLLGNDDDDSGEREWSTGASLSLGFTPVWKLEAFTEWYLIASESADPQDFVDAGVTVPVGRHFLVDASLGVRVGEGAQPWFSGAGGTWRW
jgi:hypothetical protein